MIQKINSNRFWIPFIGYVLFMVDDKGVESISEETIEKFAIWHGCWLSMGLPLIIALIIFL